MDWIKEAVKYEIEYCKARGGKPIKYPNFIYIFNESVPLAGDYNCALDVKISDFQSFEEIVEQVERIHRERNLPRPNCYRLRPPPLNEELWRNYLFQKGFSLTTSIYFQSPTFVRILPQEISLYTPSQNEYIEWYHTLMRREEWFDEEWFEMIKPSQLKFITIYIPYWLIKEGRLIGWIYCAHFAKCSHLFDVWIEEEFRGQGYGRLLLDAIRVEAKKRGARFVLLSTYENRRRFYERCGFEECARSSEIWLEEA
jgi:ribosomal protein S18 acetylase RimI-like enzyme